MTLSRRAEARSWGKLQASATRTDGRVVDGDGLEAGSRRAVQSLWALDFMTRSCVSGCHDSQDIDRLRQERDPCTKAPPRLTVPDPAVVECLDEAGEALFYLSALPSLANEAFRWRT